ncbi:MAG: hypothetical protein PHW73_08880 [Atribacterota bacterium]|jgi:hypothetical protein|nr:hypothetical protein [Atribacterota bacterium]
MNTYCITLRKEEEFSSEEEKKVYWIVMNAGLNAMHIDNCDWLEETKMWAKAKDYFPNLSWEEFLVIARKYSVWNTYEKEVLEAK